MATTDTSGFVYVFATDQGWYKIGRSRRPQKRVKAFDSLPFKVWIDYVIPTPDAPALEAALHRRFAGSRVSVEWFTLSEADLAWIRAHHAADPAFTTIREVPKSNRGNTLFHQTQDSRLRGLLRRLAKQAGIGRAQIPFTCDEVRLVLLPKKDHCARCGTSLTAKSSHLRWITPPHLGGPADPSNVELLCTKCITSQSTGRVGTPLPRLPARV